MTKKISNRFSPEVRQRAVRMVLDHGGDHASQWSAIGSIAAKIGCTAETLRKWVRQAERDQGLRAGPTTTEQERIKALEREVRELRQANEILRKAALLGSDLAIETGHLLRLAFGRPWRQTEGLLRSLATLLDLSLVVRPDAETADCAIQAAKGRLAGGQ